MRLLGATAVRRAALGYLLGEAATEAIRLAGRDALGDEPYETTLKEGEALSIEAAVAYASRVRGERGRPAGLRMAEPYAHRMGGRPAWPIVPNSPPK